jgi:hypothetical protein
LVLLDGSGHDVALDADAPAGAAVLAFLDRVLGAGAGHGVRPQPAP